ncbi:type IV pilus modification protein PilV [Pseudomonas kuykendallii]|uniref:Type IV pilus modification protein PilV n=1 Tax=Pseudomonas kuykendallii TaxID=1007099 RepID=A0A2W5CZ04_9PSED|nr:type IV pilus modification protein PilV [Pseudomonas kuykendallii]PZP23338.1 MAG: type IV pilus modification protein PilV [Pseudomonas kuykendallii]
MNNTFTKGFSLIEVLITLVLICIGVLGMVAMQGRTIQYTQDSVQRNTAAVLANDLIELMRAMPNGLPAASDFYKSKSEDFPTATDDECQASPSTAEKQLACWAKKLDLSLPDASSLANEMYVCRSKTENSCTGDGSAVEIQIAWRVKKGECMEANLATDADKTICHYRLRSQI